MKRSCRKRRRGLGAVVAHCGEGAITFGVREVADFRASWPASRLGGLRSVRAKFSRQGDLVDIVCNRRACHAFDGPALVALVEDMQTAFNRRCRGVRPKAIPQFPRR